MATAVVELSTYTAILVTYSFDLLFQSTQFAYLFPNLTLNTLQPPAQITVVITFVNISEFLERDNHESEFC
jgi:hypothetical protein